MTKERMKDLLDLTLKCRGMEEIHIELNIEKYGERMCVYVNKSKEGSGFFIYTTSPLDHSYTNGTIRSIVDPNLKLAEEHVRRLMEEKK